MVRKRNIAKWTEPIIVLAVFAVAIVHLWGMLKQDPEKAIVVSDYGDNYLTWYYIIESTLIDFIFALVLFLKAISIRSCLYTKICTALYLSISVWSIIYLMFMFDYDIYIEVFTMIFNIAIIGLALIPILKWLSRRP